VVAGGRRAVEGRGAGELGLADDTAEELQTRARVGALRLEVGRRGPGVLGCDAHPFHTRREIEDSGPADVFDRSRDDAVVEREIGVPVDLAEREHHVQ
jgi:hypothetical protein